MEEAPRGFTLIETVVALAILMLVLLLGMALLAEEPRIVERLEARSAAWDALEGALEALRAGELPLASGSLPVSDDLSIEIEVEESPVPELFDVTLSAHYRVQGQPFAPRLETRVWQR